MVGQAGWLHVHPSLIACLDQMGTVTATGRGTALASDPIWWCAAILMLPCSVPGWLQAQKLWLILT